MLINLVKVFLPTTFAFFLGILITPLATHYFYKHKMWKKKVRSESVLTPNFQMIHATKAAAEISVPCVGGSIIWISVLLTTVVFFFLSVIFPGGVFEKFNFLSRQQTFIPVGILLLGAILGLVDDFLEIIGKWNITRDSKWYTALKVLLVIVMGLLAGVWFYYKLGIFSVHIPFNGDLQLGIFFILFVVIVMLATFSGGVIDGLDGLSGGVLATIFAAYCVIAFTENQLDLATFAGVTTGATLAFLWFNIPPARFYMGETGIMPLTMTIATLAFLTDTVLVLPIIAFPLVATSFSSILQLSTKKFMKKRIFWVAPLHHHFESLGWPSYKVTMRFWILSIIFAIIGIILAIISR